MTLTISIIFGLLCAMCYLFGYFIGNRHPSRTDGEIKVDEYELKGMALYVDLPDLQKKRCLHIKITQDHTEDT